MQRDARGRYTAWLSASDSPQRLFLAVQAMGGTVQSLVPLRRSLEEVFLQAVQDGCVHARIDAALHAFPAIGVAGNFQAEPVRLIDDGLHFLEGERG